jgi:nucleoid-associated protein YgaU
MKRIFVYSLIVGFSMALAGCQMFQKKEQPQESTEDQSVLSQSTPESSAPEAAPAPEAQPMPMAPAAGRTHVVQPKETIFSLSRTYYGDEHQWRKIWEANKDQIPDPNKIKIGQQLIIPQ